MPGYAGKNLVVKLGTLATPGTPVALTGITTATGNFEAPDINVTGTADTTQTHVAGLPDASWALSGFMTTASDAQLSALKGGVASVALEVGPLGTTASQGFPKYTGSYIVQAYSVNPDYNGAVSISATLLPTTSATFGTY